MLFMHLWSVQHKTFYFILKMFLSNNDKFILNIIYNINLKNEYNPNFSFKPAKVTAHWHQGTTYMVKFEESVISRDKMLEDK